MCKSLRMYSLRFGRQASSVPAIIHRPVVQLAAPLMLGYGLEYLAGTRRGILCIMPQKRVTSLPA